MANKVIAQNKLDMPVVTHMELLEIAEIKTDKGTIKAKFAYDAAPHTVDNFVSLSRQKFYDGSAFRRIMAGFIIQEGGDSGSAMLSGRAGTGGPGYWMPWRSLGTSCMSAGVLSMARSRSVDGGVAVSVVREGRGRWMGAVYGVWGCD